MQLVEMIGTRSLIGCSVLVVRCQLSVVREYEVVKIFTFGEWWGMKNLDEGFHIVIWSLFDHELSSPEHSKKIRGYPEILCEAKLRKHLSKDKYLQSLVNPSSNN